MNMLDCSVITEKLMSKLKNGAYFFIDDIAYSVSEYGSYGTQAKDYVEILGVKQNLIHLCKIEEIISSFWPELICSDEIASGIKAEKKYIQALQTIKENSIHLFIFEQVLPYLGLPEPLSDTPEEYRQPIFNISELDSLVTEDIKSVQPFAIIGNCHSKLETTANAHSIKVFIDKKYLYGSLDLTSKLSILLGHSIGKKINPVMDEVNDKLKSEAEKLSCFSKDSGMWESNCNGENITYGFFKDNKDYYVFRNCPRHAYRHNGKVYVFDEVEVAARITSNGHLIEIKTESDVPVPIIFGERHVPKSKRLCSSYRHPFVSNGLSTERRICYGNGLATKAKLDACLSGQNSSSRSIGNIGSIESIGSIEGVGKAIAVSVKHRGIDTLMYGYTSGCTPYNNLAEFIPLNVPVDQDRTNNILSSVKYITDVK